MIGVRATKRLESLRRIEDAAAALFARRGYEGTTMEEIARAAGVAPRTLFRYCPTKIETLLQPVREVETSIAKRTEAASGPVRLRQLELFIEDVLIELDNGDEALLERLLRARRLLDADDDLRRAVFAWDGEHLIDLEQRWTSRGSPGGESPESAEPLAVPLAVLTLRSAFDRWATMRESGRPKPLANAYREAVETLRRTIAP